MPNSDDDLDEVASPYSDDAMDLDELERGMWVEISGCEAERLSQQRAEASFPSVSLLQLYTEFWNGWIQNRIITRFRFITSFVPTRTQKYHSDSSEEESWDHRSRLSRSVRAQFR